MEPEVQTEFVPKLYQMLDNPNYHEIVSWGEEPGSFVIYDTTAFQELVIPEVFKHSNFSSFVRQLNKYDFHKLRFKDKPSKFCQFQHPDFKPENRDRTYLIKRKEVQARKQIPASLIEDFQRQLDALYYRVDSLEMENTHMLGIVNRQDQLIKQLQQMAMGADQVLHFLVALDDAEGRNICSQFLADFAPNKVQIDQAVSGTEVLEMTQRKNYRCIVIDLVLPAIDGMSVTDVLRSRGFLNAIIICVEEDVDSSRRDNFFKRGASGILNRPFNRNVFYEQLKLLGV
ncbi:Transcription factor prr1 [Wickerhamiella sorbophila]|uniref:Transcription factor prr1 n=1 Tax=Wickerhamiella sorbophila TaxID=45607 RepID=A0A2T0FPJ4_9ASCO|nr:Transcription factor prr1 [Wickerhamiella sorbophila]PRT56906.1 Transcription factor prr1 [Wickerhamiella sorbophila]